MRHLTRSGPGARGVCDGGSVARRRRGARSRRKILIGSQCDRTGPTQLVGTVFCPAVQDYVNLINSKGGVDGYKVRINEIDNNYQVPAAIEEYERHKQEGAVSYLIWGTPQAEALNPRLEKDHIPALRRASAPRPRRMARSIPICSRSPRPIGRRRAAGDQFVKDKLGGRPEGQEDRLSLLRQSGGPRAAADPQGIAAERGLRTAHLRRAAARRGDERADPGHRAALPARLRARASVRPRAVGGDQGAEELGLSAEQGAGLRLGIVRGRHRGGRRLGAWRRATTRCSSSASATTIR